MTDLIHQFKDGRVGKLIEYKFIDGQWNVKDSMMLWVYNHLVLRGDTFYNVDHNKWNPLPYWKSCRTFLGFVDEKIVGMFWISSWNPCNKSGFLNFSFLDTADDIMTVASFGAVGTRMMCDHPDFLTLYAETSVCREATLKFAEYVGFKKIGVIPNAHWHEDEGRWYDTAFMYINKDLVRR